LPERAVTPEPVFRNRRRLLKMAAGERVPTQIFNGYGAFVADLYRGIEGERLFM
jgi:hypothetical protein